MSCIEQNKDFNNTLIDPKVTISSSINTATVGQHKFTSTYADRKIAFTGPASTVILSYNDNLPDLENSLTGNAISKYKSIWDLGNGEQLYGNNCKCVFSEPGEYNITLTVIDVCGEAYTLPEPYVCKLLVFDVLETGITFADLSPLSGYQSHKTETRRVMLYKSWQHLDQSDTINFYLSGSQSVPLSDEIYKNEKYSHLIPTHRVITSADAELDAPVNSIDVPQCNIYIDSTGSLTTEPTGSFIGTSGYIDISLVDDLPGSRILFATTDNLHDHNTTKSSGIHVDIHPYTDDVELSVTTNGLPEFTLSGPTGQRFESVSIPLTVTAITSTGVTLPAITSQLESINIQSNLPANWVIDTGVSPIIDNNIFSSITFSNVDATYTEQLTATATLNGELIDGTSSVFSVVPTGSIPAISKIGEDNNLFAIVKSFILQETINNKQQFIDTFLRSVIGDKDTASSFIGTQVYEKITNFNLNISDPDTCDISSLGSLAHSVGYNNISTDDVLGWPPEFKRLLNLLSISQQRLFGYRKPVTSNFDKKGFTDNPKYGINQGALIGSRSSGSYECNTYVVSAGIDIIARQIFNNEFIHITPMIIEDPVNGMVSSYPLSSYSTDWGWGLYTESHETGIFDLHENYEFFEYNIPDESSTISQYARDTVAGTFTGYVSGYEPVNNIINWSDTRTTVNPESTPVEWDTTSMSILEKELRYRLDLLQL